MEIKYKFVNGEETSVEVYDDFEKIILELNRNLYNNNQAETRRHVSLDVFRQDKTMLKDTGLDLEDQILNRTDSEALYKAISKLKPDGKSLIYRLCLSDKPMTQKQYAGALGNYRKCNSIKIGKS